MKQSISPEHRELTHSMAHYLLSIHKLRETSGSARVTDIANEMKLTKGSVSVAIGNLKNKALVEDDESGKGVQLSASGHKVVHKVLSSRTLLYYFLKDFLKVTEDKAHSDSCHMEHLMSDETSHNLFMFMKSLLRLKEMRFRTSLDLEKYTTLREFESDQLGDTHL
jgi:DtxR family Mn-dependent transcriptional regulator